MAGESSMASRKEALVFARFPPPCRIPFPITWLCLLSLLTLFFILVSPASPQTSSQQYVYASAPGSSSPSSVPGFANVSQTGALHLLANSPFNERLEGGLLAIDGQGKFLFVLNPTSDDVSMFQIDPATGNLSEVLGSPFAVPTIPFSTSPPAQPLSMATERSGQFLFVGYLLADSANSTGSSAIVSLAIDTSGSSPILRFVGSVFTLAAPIQLLTDSKGLRLYAGMGIGNNGTMQSGPEVYSIDGAGNLSFQGIAPNPENRGTDFAIDPQDRFVFAVGGLMAAHLVACVISPVDGTLPTCGPPLDLSATLPGMVVESSGHFLYIPDFPQSAVAFSVDQTTGDATQVASLPGIVLSQGASVADPMGPYIYSSDPSFTAGGVHTYLVDQQTGNLTEIPGSPFTAGVSVCCQGLAITGNPVQPVSGPAAALFPSTASNFTATAGFNSAPQTFSLVNIGNQLLAINSISLAGADSSSFSQTNTCSAALSSNAHCSISVTFNPATSGAFTATLQIADNAPGSPQTLALNGTGFTPVPGISFSPPSLSFPLPPFAATTQGTSSASETLTITNSGNAPLHISSVSLSGPNPSDFTFTNNCTAALAPSANCTLSVVFSPIAPGQRTASLLFSDDAPGSPQGVSLTGTAIAAFSSGPAPGSSTTVSVSAGQPAQYQLQLTPGAGFTGTVGLTCSGAPLGAVCQVPANVSLANGAPATFTVTVTTSGPAFMPPLSPLRLPPISTLPLPEPLALALLLFLLILFATNQRASERVSAGSRAAFCAALSAGIFCVTLGLSGCGGGGAAVTPSPSPVITPSGTSTITISLSATSSSGQFLQLQPIQLMLTVK